MNAMKIAHVKQNDFDRMWLALKPADRHFDEMTLRGTLVNGVFVVPEFENAIASIEEVMESIGEPYMSAAGVRAEKKRA